MALFVLVTVPIVDLVQPRPGVRDDQLAHQILHRQRRQMRPHGAAEIVQHEGRQPVLFFGLAPFPALASARIFAAD